MYVCLALIYSRAAWALYSVKEKGNCLDHTAEKDPRPSFLRKERNYSFHHARSRNPRRSLFLHINPSDMSLCLVKQNKSNPDYSNGVLPYPRITHYPRSVPNQLLYAHYFQCGAGDHSAGAGVTSCVIASVCRFGSEEQA